MISTKLEKWEEKLDNILDEIDDILEDKLGNKYRLHPARPKQGETANKSMDGLFDIAASFTLGLGSELGRGYVLKIKIVTLEKVSPDVQKMVENITMNKISERLPQVFPDRELDIKYDGNILKIYGDLNLDKV